MDNFNYDYTIRRMKQIMQDGPPEFKPLTRRECTQLGMIIDNPLYGLNVSDNVQPTEPLPPSTPNAEENT